MTWTNRTINFLDDLERVALALVARLGPWLAPVGPAYAVYRAGVRHLDMPGPVAVAMGVAIEVVGISAAHATLRARSWNQERPAGSPPAPARLGALLVVLYLAIGICLAVVVELVPKLVPLSPAILFLLAAVAYIVLALTADQARREVAAESEAATSAAQRLASRAFWATVKERGLSRAEGQRALHQAGGDYGLALDCLPEVSGAGGWELGAGGRGLEAGGRGLEAGGRGLGGGPRPAVVERVPEFDQRLRIVREQSGEGSFHWRDVAQWLGCGKTTAYDLLRYGQDVGLVKWAGRGIYQFDNGKGD